MGAATVKHSRRHVLAALIGAVLCCLSAAPALAGSERDLITNLANQAEPVLNNKSLSEGERAEALRGILRKVFDRKQMAKAMLGRYWRRASSTQKTALVGLMESYLIDVYAGRVSSIEGHVKFQIDGDRDLGNRTLVDTQVLRPPSPPVIVAWQVETVGNRPVVTDIIVEGISLIVSQRADFASIVRSRGGLDGLIDLLRKKVKTAS